MPEFSGDIPFSEVNRKILAGLKPPFTRYYLFMGILALLTGWGVIAWIYQVKTGMGVSGLNHPVGWGTYITSFVFWIGIAHSGTLISAILYLVRSKGRDAVSRTTEAMTVIAIITAGIFPLVHLGRLWVFYYILPYPSERGLYPNFMSPLVWDVIAVLTYFVVSVLFFYFGLIPDAASVRDHYEEKYGKDHWKTKTFRYLSMGWSGTLSEWRHYNRSYLYFAALATPLVVSVHSIVSWDFAMSLLPGWHSTLFAPYFVAGAIHSGLAMALTLLIPMRKLLNLKQLITDAHLEMISKIIILTTIIIAYSYIVEPLIESYSGNIFHTQFSHWRMTGPLSWIYFMILFLNVCVPLTFLSATLRRKIKWLFIASLLINVGMWFERLFIVIGSTEHDFMPHNWGSYFPSWVELSIFAGLASMFLFLFLAFVKFLPVISIADFKDYLSGGQLPGEAKEYRGKREKYPQGKPELIKKMLVFPSPKALTVAVKRFSEKGFNDIETFSPSKVPEVEKMLGIEKSPVSYWTVTGGILGFLAGYFMTVGSVQRYQLIVGGKHPVSLIPYFLIMFELTILFATLFNFLSSVFYMKLYRFRLKPYYDKRFSVDKFGLLITFRKGEDEVVNRIAMHTNSEEVYEYR